MGNVHLLDWYREHACQYGWNGCRASSLDAPGDAKRSRRIRTVDYSKPGGEAPFSVPAMSGMAGRSPSSALSCLLPFLPAAFPACCLSCLLLVASPVCCFFCLLLAACPACCLLPFLPVACCLSACCFLPSLLVAFAAYCLLPVACCQFCLCAYTSCAPHCLMSWCPLLPDARLLCTAFPTLLAFSHGPFLQSRGSLALLEFARLSSQSTTCLLPLVLLAGVTCMLQC